MTQSVNNPLDITDDDLIARVLHGRCECYGELVRRHQDTIYRHMRGMGLDHDTSLDLVQDAFIKGYARLSECRERQYFRAWLFRIGRNLCLDYLKNVRRLTVPLSTIPDSAHPAQENGDDEMQHTLRKALGSLPVALREAFLLKHDAGYTYEEVAELTEASPSAVKMRVHRAREALRDYLAERGVYAA